MSLELTVLKINFDLNYFKGSEEASACINYEYGIPNSTMNTITTYLAIYSILFIHVPLSYVTLLIFSMSSPFLP